MDDLEASRRYGPVTGYGTDGGYLWVELPHPTLLGMNAFVNVWQQDVGQDTGCLFARIIPPGPATGLPSPPPAPQTDQATASSSQDRRPGGPTDPPPPLPDGGTRNPVTPQGASEARLKRATDPRPEQTRDDEWRNWTGTRSWDERGSEAGGWARHNWWDHDYAPGDDYQSRRTPDPSPPWANWGGVTGNVLPWGDQLYRVSRYTWTLRGEAPKDNIKRLQRELGCFFVEAWHAYLDHHSWPSKDPKLCSEQCCTDFLALVEENEYDVRTALKKMQIRVNWKRAGDKINTATNPGTWGQQRDRWR